MRGTTEYWMEDVETASRPDLAKVQLEKLKKVLGYCQSRSKFYQKKFGDAGVSISKVKRLEDIDTLPLTSREEIVTDQMENGRLGSIMCTEFEEPGQTIGMTGIKFSATERPIRVIISIEDAASQGRLAARGLTCAGVQPKDYLFSMDFPQFNLLYMHMGLGCINLGSKNLSAGMERAERNTSIYTRLYPPGAFNISPTYSKLVTKLLKQTGKRYPIHAILGWSEPGYSLPSWKKQFKEMWGEVSDQPEITVCDVYGMVEVGLLAFECTNEKGLHGFEDAHIYEIIDPNTGDVLPPGEEGELVITHLEREGMPLIRYRTGDITSLQLERCECGRTHLRLMGIKGRLDQAINVAGKKIYQSQIEETLGSIKDYSGEFNVVVNGSEILSILELRVLKDSISEKVQRDLEDVCGKKLGVPVRIQYVAKEDLVTFVHRSQKVMRAESLERLKKEAASQLRGET